MFQKVKAFSGFSVDNIDKAKHFYGTILGLQLTEESDMLILHLATGGEVLVYPKEDHQPATYTILNFPVDDIDKAMDDLARLGVTFKHYENKDMPQDEKGIMRGLSLGMGPDIAWFTDPAGNVLSILQEK
jgi:catechol 2,3-dioxygenase-like lactoylglutathione lyase family enzyme